MQITIGINRLCFVKSSFSPTKGAESRPQGGISAPTFVRAACGENKCRSGGQLGIRAAVVVVSLFRFTKNLHFCWWHYAWAPPQAARTIDYYVRLPDIMIFVYPTGNVAYWQYLVCRVSFILDYINGKKHVKLTDGWNALFLHRSGSWKMQAKTITWQED